MSTSKHIDKICIAAVAVALVITILFMCGQSLGIAVKSKAVKYESTLFDNSYVHKIDIVMNDWDSFIENCENEEYASCTVVVDGEKHANTAIRAKGNTSLSSVKQSGSQRYSFKLEFDHYDESKTLDGLDKLCLNNLIQDTTMMKDYIAYTLMNDFGADSPLCSFVYITVNGEDWGLYLAVESIEDSFLSRNYGSEAGELYKPDSMSFGGGRGNGRNFNMDDFDFSGDDSQQDEKDGKSTDNQKSSKSGKTDSSGANSFGGQTPPGGFEMPDGFSSDSGLPGFPGGNSQQGDFPSGGDFSEFPGGSSDSPFGRGFPGGDSSGFSFDGQTPPEGFSFDGGFPGQTGESTPSDAGTASDADKSSGRSKMPGGFGMGSDDVKLKYIDDDVDSYSNIFDNAKTTVSKADKKRLIKSLKKLSSYEDLEEILDTDEVLRYFVVHNFVCNGDSYTGMMIHNYYLHESDGKLSMIPWDYNLAFGTFQGGDASGTINTSIDSPISMGNSDDRPMLGWIFSDESYTEKYHELFSEFIDKWFSDGQLEKMISDTADMIRPYVEKDPTKFCTAEDFEKGVAALSSFASLRAEAVRRQLSGDDTPVETGSLNLSDMGSMGGGMGKGMGGGSFGNFNMLSMVTLTDSEGNKVEVSEVIEDTSSITGLTLSDGTEIDLSSSDMKNLMKTDFSKIVSATDKEGNKIDLSGYTVSMSFSDGMGGGRSRGGNRSAENSGGDSEDKSGSFSREGAPSSFGRKPGEQSGEEKGTGTDGSPSSPGGSFSPQGGFPGNMSSGNSNKTFMILTGISAAVLVFGILIALKKKF